MSDEDEASNAAPIVINLEQMNGEDGAATP